MKAYKVEVLVLDFENYGEEQIAMILGNVDAIMCSAQRIQSADIGEWHDKHPLNFGATQTEEFDRLFPR